MVLVQPGGSSTNISGVEVAGFTVQLDLAPTAKAICAYSLRDPSSLHNIRIHGGTGRSVEVDTSSIPTTPAISEGIHFYDIFDETQVATPKTADRWLIRADDCVIGPAVTIVSPIYPVEGTYAGLVIDSHASGGVTGLGYGITIQGSAFANFHNCVKVTGSLGEAGPKGVAIVDNRFENCSYAWSLTGGDAAGPTNKDIVNGNFYLNVTKMGILDYATQSSVDETVTSGGAGTITLTANSGYNQVRVVYGSGITDVSDSGTANCVIGQWQPGGVLNDWTFACGTMMFFDATPIDAYDRLHIKTPSGGNVLPTVESTVNGASSGWRFKAKDASAVAQEFQLGQEIVGDDNFEIYDKTAGKDLLTVAKSTGHLQLAASKGQHIQTNAAGSDTSGTCTISSSTSCSITFTTSWAATPVCTANSSATGSGAVAVTSIGTTGATFTVPTNGTYTVYYHCFGNPN